MQVKPTIPFEITAMDSLGQGVSKVTEKVTFIPKTVIGDKGEASVMSEKKGVAFARLKKLHVSSSSRVTPQCVHFNSCPSCHYLHIDYQDELKFKKESFEKLFRKLPLPAVEVIAAGQRFSYRNRIQLHYSLKSKLLGMKDPRTFEIIPIPHCLIAVPEVTNEIKRLYENQNWLKHAPAAPTEGHVEIYWDQGHLKLSWNRPYSEGGFTQVFEEMNLKLKEIIKNQWQPGEKLQLLDLFGGNGNLSNELNYSERLCVDIYNSQPGEEFYSQNIYDAKALKSVSNELKKKRITPHQLLLDPPRSGLKNLDEWVSFFGPQSIAYVSCDPHTLVRDLELLKNYTIKKAFLIDFFPSTFHFESLIFLDKNLL